MLHIGACSNAALLISFSKIELARTWTMDDRPSYSCIFCLFSLLSELYQSWFWSFLFTFSFLFSIVIFCFSVAKIQAISFQSCPLTYSISPANPSFSFDQNSGALTLASTLQYTKSPHQFVFNVTATESFTNFQTSTMVRTRYFYLDYSVLVFRT